MNCFKDKGHYKDHFESCDKIEDYNKTFNIIKDHF